jgi:hypothetical protein
MSRKIAFQRETVYLRKVLKDVTASRQFLEISHFVIFFEISFDFGKKI